MSMGITRRSFPWSCFTLQNDPILDEKRGVLSRVGSLGADYWTWIHQPYEGNLRWHFAFHSMFYFITLTSFIWVNQFSQKLTSISLLLSLQAIRFWFHGESHAYILVGGAAGLAADCSALQYSLFLQIVRSIRLVSADGLLTIHSSFENMNYHIIS